MMRLPVSLVTGFMRRVEKPHLRNARDPLAVRARLERQGKWLFQMPAFTTILPDRLQVGDNAVDALWVNARNARKDKLILYFHGGGYMMGSPRTHSAMLARLSELSGMSCILPDYRKAPENLFPDGVKDAVTAYQALLDRGYAPENIALGGDSAGGGLCFGLLHYICTNGLPRPGAVFGFSPWTDLTLSGDSFTKNAVADPFLSAERAVELVSMYLGSNDPRDPRASPLFGTFTGAPPVFLQVGETEILLDDSRRLAEALKDQGVMVTLDIWPDVPHVWQILQTFLAQADTALIQMARFLNKTV